MARIGDGVFKGTPQGPQLVSGPRETHDMLAQLYAIANKAREENLTAKEILEEVAEINPELARKLGRRFLPAYLIILLLFFFVKHIDLKLDINVNHLVDQAWHISQHEDPEKHLEEFLTKLQVPKAQAKERGGKSNAVAKRAKRREQRAHLRRKRLTRRPAERPKRLPHSES
jgi:hypothetical protein